MENMTLEDISKAMRKIDICMMTTRNADGSLESRPMSNNKDVDYEGNSYFFAVDTARVVRDLESNPQIALSYEGKNNLYINVSGVADLTQDKAMLQQHWVANLNHWFESGIDTQGLTLIHVKAQHIKFWHKYEEGEVSLNHGPDGVAGLGLDTIGRASVF